MINITDKTTCNGCEACLNICPTNAIGMVNDNEGFRYPYVHLEKCINCKKCINTCPIENFDKRMNYRKKSNVAYAFKSNDEIVRKKSSSGGAFYSIAKKILTENGIVFGACFDAQYHLVHKSAENEEELIPLLGSKYLQSSIGDTYKQVKTELENNRKVLFVGMTCQVEGLHAFLNKDYQELYCIDLICMGVPSPYAWEKYINGFFDISQLNMVNFKDKSLGWHKFSMCIENKNKSVFKESGFDNYYMEAMFKSYTIRPSCFSCQYKCEEKISDVTIADCWGCEKYMKELDDNKGLSMLIPHSDKGEKLIKIMPITGSLKEFSYENVLKYNPNYNNSTSSKHGRWLFYFLLNRKPKIAYTLMGKNPNKKLHIRLKYKIISYFRSVKKQKG